jgi:hypothetical protein
MAGYPVGFEFIIGPRTSGKDRIADRLDLLDERRGPARMDPIVEERGDKPKN